MPRVPRACQRLHCCRHCPTPSQVACCLHMCMVSVTCTTGLGVDNVLRIDVVLPNATLVSVTKCSAPELWMALRGGGGGTFGVMVAATHRLHPNVGVVSVSAAYPLGTCERSHVSSARCCGDCSLLLAACFVAFACNRRRGQLNGVSRCCHGLSTGAVRRHAICGAPHAILDNPCCAVSNNTEK